MDIVRLDRIFNCSDYCIGKVYVNGNYFCDSIEDNVRDLKSAKDKVYSKTAIPQGSYNVIWDYSERFKKTMPHILEVPYFEGVRIHSGNTAEDSAGCIILGMNIIKGAVLNSRETIDRFNKLLYKKPFKLAINNFFK